MNPTVLLGSRECPMPVATDRKAPTRRDGAPHEGERTSYGSGRTTTDGRVA